MPFWSASAWLKSLVKSSADSRHSFVEPEAGSPVFEGLGGHLFLQVKRAVSKAEMLVGVNVCEVAPPNETSGQTEQLG